MSSPFEDEDEESKTPRGAAGPLSPKEPPLSLQRSQLLKRPNMAEAGGGGGGSEAGSLPECWKDEEWKKKQKARLEREMDVELQKVRADSAMEREEAYDNLCNSKDRTQTTSVIALFILEVNVLKDLVVYNRLDGTWFYVVLGLLLTSMFVTALAGFLLMIVYNIKSKIKKMGPSMVDAAAGYGTFTIAKHHKLFSGDELKLDRQPLVLDDAEEPGGFWTCFGSICGPEEESLEDRLLRMYKKCYIHELQATLDFAHAQSEAGKLDRDLVAAAEQADYFNDPSGGAFPADYFDDDPSAESAKLKKLVDNWHHLKTLRKQSSTLLQRAMEIKRRKWFGRLLLLQNWVTHLIFALCLLEILTIAFGFSLSWNDYSSSGRPVN